MARIPFDFNFSWSWLIMSAVRIILVHVGSVKISSIATVACSVLLLFSNTNESHRLPTAQLALTRTAMLGSWQRSSTAEAISRT